MAERETQSGAAGKVGLATFRDIDFEDFVAAVRYLPQLAKEEGTEVAIAWGRTELRSLLALLGPSRPASPTSAAYRASVGSFFDEGVLRLMADPDRAGRACQTTFIAIVAREYFEPSVPAVFERTLEREGRYVPQIPRE